MAALASFCCIAKCFDWLKLFDETAFYILLIEKTIVGIVDFMTPFWIACIMFGMPTVILKPSDPDHGDNVVRIDFSAPLNAVLDQY